MARKRGYKTTKRAVFEKKNAKRFVRMKERERDRSARYYDNWTIDYEKGEVYGEKGIEETRGGAEESGASCDDPQGKTEQGE